MTSRPILTVNNTTIIKIAILSLSAKMLNLLIYLVSGNVLQEFLDGHGILVKFKNNIANNVAKTYAATVPRFY